MLLTLTTLALALASTVSGHASVFNIFVNDKDQGNGTFNYIRSPPLPSNNPVKDIKSPNIICNLAGGTPVANFVKAAPGDKLAFRWFHFVPTDPNDILDPSHKGAILTYIAPYTTGNGAGPIWSKLAEEGFADGIWATNKMIAAGGKAEFSLPAQLAPGKYLVRQELLALHMADTRGDENPARGAEWYPSCAQIEVAGGSGTAVPDQNFDFNTGYKYDDKGIFFNMYVKFDTYTPPGPRPWTPK